ncbi:MAG: winged helix-turn-helix transcriptional regulator, partial [Caulobacteraceae bacterium]|nr:winged helix-turn-helix transcriptional regulator [Caulobacteraceae bacterium]
AREQADREQRHREGLQRAGEHVQALAFQGLIDLGRTPRSALIVLGMGDADTAGGKDKMRTVERFLRSDQSRTLIAADRLVLRALVDAAGPRDARYRDRRFVAATYIGVDALADRTGVSVSTVKRSVKRLQAAGVIARAPHYRLNTLTVIEIPWVPAKPKGTPPVAAWGEPRRGPERTARGSEVVHERGQSEPAHPISTSDQYIQAAAAATHALETPRGAGSVGGGPAAAAAGSTASQADREHAAIVDALIAVGIRGNTVQAKAAALVAAGGTVADAQRVIADWSSRGTRKHVGTGLLLGMIDDHVHTLERSKAQRAAAAAAAADEEYTAVAATLHADENARANAVRGFVAAGGDRHDADTMSDRFITWAVGITRANGKIRSIVQVHRRERARAIT